MVQGNVSTLDSSVMESMTVKTTLMNETVVSTQVKLRSPAVQDCRNAKNICFKDISFA